MATCVSCGAPVAFGTERVVQCKYCGSENRAAPTEVQVPVPVQVVHKVVHVAGGAEEARELRCPHCRKRLVGVVVSDVELHGCVGCGGIWIDNDSARRVLAKPEPVFGQLAVRAGLNAARKGASRDTRPSCPACPGVLDLVKVHGICLDVCGDHGTWFDAFELKALVDALGRAPKDGAPGRADPQRVVSCVACGVSIPFARANIGEKGATCDACWRTRQTELTAAFEANATVSAPSLARGLSALLEAVTEGA